MISDYKIFDWNWWLDIERPWLYSPSHARTAKEKALLPSNSVRLRGTPTRAAHKLLSLYSFVFFCVSLGEGTECAGRERDQLVCFITRGHRHSQRGSWQRERAREKCMWLLMSWVQKSVVCIATRGRERERERAWVFLFTCMEKRTRGQEDMFILGYLIIG